MKYKFTLDTLLNVHSGASAIRLRIWFAEDDWFVWKTTNIGDSDYHTLRNIKVELGISSWWMEEKDIPIVEHYRGLLIGGTLEIEDEDRVMLKLTHNLGNCDN